MTIFIYNVFERSFRVNNLQRKKQGLPYHYDDANLYHGQREHQELLYDYNQLRPTQIAEKQQLLKKMLATIGEGCTIETPLAANWGGCHVYFGKDIYCNSHLTLVDDGNIYIGDHTMIGPNVVIATAGHPILPLLREHKYVYCQDVHIGKNVWIGANVTVLPGVTIGDNSVIGAGSVVTRDIPSNVVAYGLPCKVQRSIGKKDKLYYFRDKKLDIGE